MVVHSHRHHDVMKYDERQCNQIDANHNEAMVMRHPCTPYIVFVTASHMHGLLDSAISK